MGYLRKIARVPRVVSALLTDPRFRAGIGRELEASRLRSEQLPADAELADTAAGDLVGLLSTSTLLARLDLHTQPRALNVLVSSVEPGNVFAGIDTALQVAARMARTLGAECRVVTTEESKESGANVVLTARYGTEVSIVPAQEIRTRRFGRDDIWLATHFLTAHAVQVATDLGVLDAADVVYLVQDYEPGFVPWSTEYALARATYHAGFRLLVNSTPVAEYLRTHEDLDIDPACVFAPALDEERLGAIASARRPRAARRVVFYGRPHRHRNLYRLGLSALRSAVRQLGDAATRIEFVSVGGDHDPIRLSDDVMLRPLGKLAWDDYFDYLAEVDVMLSLQHSPHPSHPPLEAALAGATAITNEFDGFRADLHPRLVATAPTVAALAEAIVRAVVAPAELAPGPTPLRHSLGVTLDAAVDAVVAPLMR